MVGEVIAMGNEVPVSVPEVDSSKPASMAVMISRIHSKGLQQAAADENAHVNRASLPRGGAGKPPPPPAASSSGRKVHRMSTGSLDQIHETGLALSRIPLLGQQQRRGARVGPASPGSFAVATSTPTRSTTGAKRGTSAAASPPASCKRPRSRFSVHDPAQSGSQGSRPPLPHRDAEEGGRFSILSHSSSPPTLYGSAQISVARDLIQTYPSTSAFSSRPAFHPRDPTPGQRRGDVCRSADPTRSQSPVDEEDHATSNLLPAFCASSPPSFDQVDAIREAVRAYTLLSRGERSSACEPVRTILDLTGYVLASPVSSSTEALGPASGTRTQGLLGSPGVTTRARQADVLLKLGGDDVFRHLDACKVRDASLALQATQCRPEKDRGFYRYVHVPTGTVVSPHAYESRYLAALNDACARQWQYWGTYFDRLKKHDDEVRKEKRDAAVRLSSSRRLGGETSSNASTDATPARLLPFPSRDETSSDPDVALAERELWDKIDSALEEYSHKVLTIQERRRGAL